MQKVQKYIYKQLERPVGTFGKMMAYLMTLKNHELNQWMANQIEIRPNDKILEVGFGTGDALLHLSERIGEGNMLAGIDHSEIMFDMAVKKNEQRFWSGKLLLEQGTVWDLQYPEASFDTIFAVNVHAFWEQPFVELRWLRELLKEGGKLSLVVDSKKEDPMHVYQNLLESGFEKEMIEDVKVPSFHAICLTATK